MKKNSGEEFINPALHSCYPCLKYIRQLCIGRKFSVAIPIYKVTDIMQNP